MLFALVRGDTKGSAGFSYHFQCLVVLGAYQAIPGGVRHVGGDYQVIAVGSEALFNWVDLDMQRAGTCPAFSAPTRLPSTAIRDAAGIQKIKVVGLAVWW